MPENPGSLGSLKRQRTRSSLPGVPAPAADAA
jgi:hypothetical protein